MSWAVLTAQLAQAESAAREFDEETLRRIVEQLLPEFVAAQNAGGDNVVALRSS